MILVFGNGWIGNKFVQHFNAKVSPFDILDTESVAGQIIKLKPDVVINAAGKCGTPNTDWCEKTTENKRLTLYTNTFGPVILYHVVDSIAHTQNRKIKFVHLSTGCLWNKGENITEECKPEPQSWYAKTKVLGEGRLPENSLIIRMRMPIDSIPNHRNLITKVSTYTKVLNEQNSITVIDDMLVAVEKLLAADKTGTYNVVNEGTVSAADIAQAYKELVDPTYTYEIVEPSILQNNGLVSNARPCLTLCLDKLRAAGIVMPNIKERLADCMKEYAKLKKV